jgi:hypothetical protein
MNNNYCLYCNCQNEQPYKEIYKLESYLGFICFCCHTKVIYCLNCDKFHDKNEFINNTCFYQMSFYKNLINALKIAEILPNNYQ